MLLVCTPHGLLAPKWGSRGLTDINHEGLVPQVGAGRFEEPLAVEQERNEAGETLVVAAGSSNTEKPCSPHRAKVTSQFCRSLSSASVVCPKRTMTRVVGVAASRSWRGSRLGVANFDEAASASGDHVANVTGHGLGGGRRGHRLVTNAPGSGGTKAPEAGWRQGRKPGSSSQFATDGRRR
jgi:hypothetical protein